jgi:hypothetical protein
MPAAGILPERPVAGCDFGDGRVAVVRVEPSVDASPVAKEAGHVLLCHEHACLLVADPYRELSAAMSRD